MKVFAWIIAILGLVALSALIFFTSTWVLMWAWNATMPYLFHLPRIGFWMALALVVLLNYVRPRSGGSSK